MAGRAQARFMARTHARLTERSDAYQRGEKEYGAECMYCCEYFANVRRPKLGGYVCRSCDPRIS